MIIGASLLSASDLVYTSGQENMCGCVQASSIEQPLSNGGTLGILPHSLGKLIITLGVESLHFSLGPIFGTTDSKFNCDAQGVDMAAQWRAMIPSHNPLGVIDRVADADRVVQSLQVGAQVVAVSGARIQVPDVPAAGENLNESMQQ
jgi:thiamine monophosphate synthase